MTHRIADGKRSEGNDKHDYSALPYLKSKIIPRGNRLIPLIEELAAVFVVWRVRADDQSGDKGNRKSDKNC
jgi:hypothetical protein